MDARALLTAVAGERWAINRAHLNAMLAALAAGISPKAAAGRTFGGGREQRGSIAVLPLTGPIFQRDSWALDMFGGTSSVAFTRTLAALVADPNIQGIVVDVDSPGGGVFGAQEASDAVYRLRGRKPIIAVANSLMASAAYWIGSAADSISITPSGEIGSIGVIAVHLDTSKADERVGLNYTILATPEAKAERAPFKPLSDEAKRRAMAEIGATYEQFLTSVARNRGITKRDVHANYGGGRTMLAADALAAGMVDRIETLDAAIARLAGKATTPARVATVPRTTARAPKLTKAVKR